MKATHDDLLEQVSKAQSSVTEARKEFDHAVARARSAGVSWTQLGAALGMTRQGAQRRWGHKANLPARTAS